MACSGSGRPSARILDPPRGGRLLARNDAVEERGGAGEALLRRKQAVLVLDRENVIVAEHAQRRSELLPPLLAVAVAAGAEDPRPVALVGVALGVEHAGER